MPVITRLVQGKKNPNRINLFLDNEFAFALSIDEVAKQNLKKGLDLSPAQIEALKQVDEDEYLYVKILNFLSYRPRTTKEVRDRLWQYDLKDSAKQTQIIAKLQDKGYLNDEEFARWFIASRNTHRPRSTAMLKMELAAKGVAKELINVLVQENSNERQTLTRILDKKLGSHRTLDKPELLKIQTFLSRQGFPWELIHEVVKNWQSE